MAIKRVDCLDGLRGIAALWVLVGHCTILTGWRLPILGLPDLGVDLFILLSGFVMVYQYRQRSAFEDWDAPRTWLKFWVRRFFRIAPLFYTLLLVALMLGPQIYADRVAIDTALGHAPQNPLRYLDFSVGNVLLHATFLFGLLPQYAFRTPLPDWSIGLEMQFYAVFPFLVLLARRAGWLAMGAVVVAIQALLVAVLLAKGTSFPMPSFLPLKVHLFLCGMLIAAEQPTDATGLLGRLGLLLVLGAFPIGGQIDFVHTVTREMIVAGFFVLIHCRGHGAVAPLAGLLETPFARWLGELSFGVYLIHLLVMHRIAAWTLGLAPGDAVQRFGVTLLVTLAVAYGAAALLFFGIEKPGQRLGKKLEKKFMGARVGGSAGRVGWADAASPTNQTEK